MQVPIDTSEAVMQLQQSMPPPSSGGGFKRAGESRRRPHTRAVLRLPHSIAVWCASLLRGRTGPEVVCRVEGFARVVSIVPMDRMPPASSLLLLR